MKIESVTFASLSVALLVWPVQAKAAAQSNLDALLRHSTPAVIEALTTSGHVVAGAHACSDLKPTEGGKIFMLLPILVDMGLKKKLHGDTEKLTAAENAYSAAYTQTSRLIGKYPGHAGCALVRKTYRGMFAD